MGLTWQKRYDDFLLHAKKCLTWQDVKASHAAGDNQVVIKLDETYGMLIILFLGLNGAMVLMAFECLVRKLKFKKASQSMGRKITFSVHCTLNQLIVIVGPLHGLSLKMPFKEDLGDFESSSY